LNHLEERPVTLEKKRRHLPPYVSYRTFRNFLDKLQQKMPSRIDRSYWGDFLSGSNGTQLLAALRFLNLVDQNGKPADQLKKLAAARGEGRSEVLRQIMSGAYAFVPLGNVDLESATYSQVEEAFHNSFQLTEDVSRKCVKFYISLAGDAGVGVSPFVAQHTRAARGGQRTKSAREARAARTNHDRAVPQSPASTAQLSWNNLLLAKFPSFDPAWSDGIKGQWFAAFDELLKRGPR
jgi:hypothetical protein